MFGLGRETGRPSSGCRRAASRSSRHFGERFGTPTMFEQTFRLREYAGREPFATAGGFEVTPVRVPHYTLETYALRVTNGAGRSPTRATRRPSDALAEVARDADLFLCEATLADGELDGDHAGTCRRRRRSRPSTRRARGGCCSPTGRASCRPRAASSSPTTGSCSTSDRRRQKPASRARCPRPRGGRRTSRPSSRRPRAASTIGGIRLRSLAAACLLQPRERGLDRGRVAPGPHAPGPARSACARAPGRS